MDNNAEKKALENLLTMSHEERINSANEVLMSAFNEGRIQALNSLIEICSTLIRGLENEPSKKL